MLTVSHVRNHVDTIHKMLDWAIIQILKKKFDTDKPLPKPTYEDEETDKDDNKDEEMESEYEPEGNPGKYKE